MTARRPSEDVCTALGYRFSDPALLETALTHRSVCASNNERLEFLGDALLSMIIAEALYRQFPAADEGQLTRLRARLVNKDQLAAIARDLDLGRHLHLGEGEKKSGGWRRDSILANGLEALFGAIYIDGGLEACRAQVLRSYREAFEQISAAEPLKDPKTRLQEYLQARRLPVPVYETVRCEGEPHHRRFTVRCSASGLQLSVTAEGTSRRRAEQAAAEQALTALAERA